MSERNVDMVIVGAGFAGIYMLIKARQAGLNAVVYEAGDSVGGTWYWNRYPGARCDFESFDYSYEFDRDLETEWQWSERYPSQPEILAYLRHVVDRYDLADDIRLGHKVTSADFDERTETWAVTARSEAGEDRTTATYVVLATGALSEPRLPDITGIEDFKGKILQTARWPEEGVDVTGEKVGVIGTGSSGIQVIPELATQAEHLTVFQRTPSYVVPANNRRMSTTERQSVLDLRDAYRDRARGCPLGVYFPSGGPSAKGDTPEHRQEVLEDRWNLGGSALLGAYDDLLVDAESNDHVAQFIRDKIAQIVEDPDTAASLKPTYHVGSRRIVVGTDYYETFNQDHVELVDLLKTPITTITEHGATLGDRQIDLDVLVCATGFDALTGSILAIDIVGRDGERLATAWKDGPQTQLGLQMAGFPNMFIIAGPGSPSVFTNVVRSIEQHVEWISRLLERMRTQGQRVVEAEEHAQHQWVHHVNEVANSTLIPTTNSWYLGANVPGKPRVFLPYLGGAPGYRALCEQVENDGYPGFIFDGKPSRQAQREMENSHV
ncbi:MAG: flavin-containing monooxygenase [Galactobacter sp.]